MPAHSDPAMATAVANPAAQIDFSNVNFELGGLDYE